MYIGWRNKDKRKQAFVSFGRKNDERNQIQIEVDQSSDLILERMKEVVSGKRDKLYLTHGMRDIDVSYLGDNKWQLFDEFDIFEFEMAV